MRYTVTKQAIQILGRLWMPGVEAATDKTLDEYDMGNIEDVRDRDSVLNWLGANSGDFSAIIDFRADFHVGDEHIVHEWADEENEFKFSSYMFQDLDIDE
jgi:hypothetical protein